jgi:hypothetical protein
VVVAAREKDSRPLEPIHSRLQSPHACAVHNKWADLNGGMADTSSTAIVGSRHFAAIPCFSCGILHREKLARFLLLYLQAHKVTE